MLKQYMIKKVKCCERCSANFARKYHLTGHIKVDQEQKKPCNFPICDACFQMKNSLISKFLRPIHQQLTKLEFATSVQTHYKILASFLHFVPRFFLKTIPIIGKIIFIVKLNQTLFFYITDFLERSYWILRNLS